MCIHIYFIFFFYLNRTFGVARDSRPLGTYKTFGIIRDPGPLGTRKTFGAKRDPGPLGTLQTFGVTSNPGPLGTLETFEAARDLGPLGTPRRIIRILVSCCTPRREPSQRSNTGPLAIRQTNEPDWSLFWNTIPDPISAPPVPL